MRDYREERMPGITDGRSQELRQDFEKVLQILKASPGIDKDLAVPPEEFPRRQKSTWLALKQAGLDVGFVFSDEHYNGDVPYLGGNTNITIEQVAGVIGEQGFHVVAGLEGGYVSEQLAGRAGARVHKVELLQLADEKYPIRAERLEDVLEEAAGRRPAGLDCSPRGRSSRMGLLHSSKKSPGRRTWLNAQEAYQRIRYEKSDIEMALIRDASLVGDAMLRCMLAVVRPGQLETQVAGWAYWAAKELGSEENGWDVMVLSGDANRTLIGKALNRPIRAGEFLHLGVAPKRDGLNACVRRSVVVPPSSGGMPVSGQQQYWFDFIQQAYQVGEAAYRQVARHGLPAYLQEKALVDFFAAHSAEVSHRYGKDILLETLKPYTGTHNAGYTECQEFYGAITLDSSAPLGNQIVTMLDVAIRGIGDHWNDVVLPDLDYLAIENTLGKFGVQVENFNHLPLNVQALVGTGI